MSIIDSRLAERFNAIPEKILAPDFLNGRGLGNEISFYVFDYPPQCELQMRAQIVNIEKVLHAEKPELRILKIDLFELIHDYLCQRKLWDKVLQMQRERGNNAVRDLLKAPLQGDKLTKYLADNTEIANADVVFLVGVGNAFPLLRSHAILNNLPATIGDKPLVLFFPGEYDGGNLRLLDCIASEHYYRAFRLVN